MYRWCSVWPCLVFVLMGGPARAWPSMHAHLEGGIGGATVRPLEAQSTIGALASGGFSVPVVGSLLIGLEVAASGGGDLATARIPEAPAPGNRTMVTFLAGVELRSWGRHGGAFGFLGAGIGRGHLNDARSVFVPPYDRWLEPGRDLTAFAAGAGAGYRFAGGPGPLGWALAMRTHMLIHAGAVPFATTAWTVGLAY